MDCTYVALFYLNGPSALQLAFHSHTLMATELPCKACSSGATWGPVCCPRTLRHVDRRCRGFGTGNPVISGRPALPPGWILESTVLIL